MTAAKPLAELSGIELRALLVKAHRDRRFAEYQDGMGAFDRAVREAEQLRTQVLEEAKNRMAATFTAKTLAQLCEECASELDAECRSEAYGG